MPSSRREHMTCTSLMTNTTRPLDSGCLDMMKYAPGQRDTLEVHAHSASGFDIIFMSVRSSGQAAADCRTDVRGHQPGPREEDGHHREPPPPSSTGHVLCPSMQVRETHIDDQYYIII